MRFSVYYGTESGTAEMIAEDVAAVVAEQGETVTADLQDTLWTDFDAEALHLIICSTYGEGELPASAQPFVAHLEQERPDLSGIRYAMFGLGDSGYADSYSKGSEQLAAVLDGLGAIRVGDYGRHDAAGFEDASDTAVAWANDIIHAHALA